MKKLTATLLLLLLTLTAIAQNNSKTTVFCGVFAEGRTLVKKFNIRLDMGNQSNLANFKDPGIKTQLLKVEELNNPADVLNFMSRLGWQLVNSSGINMGGTTLGFNFFFKKEVDITELNASAP